ncbi:hypothetical protein LG198_12055 [Methylobacillus arboreus]|uniref:hypothetical protein n=1 Tax=Methylobacillus arboreus TaxID=755170 RepID=UPI001E4BA969|nr:hypothetical protein [Methylobacillus arboreus]MCB5191462.1 hypothetical protein [Methylobacillus arboreus]
MSKCRISIAAFFTAAMLAMSAQADPAPVDNVVPPCDDSAATDKPDCKTDSDSVKVPPPMPGERESVIVPPEVPAEGLPNDPRTRTPDIEDRKIPKNKK